ncbi:MAG: rane-associated phospholipid phosphatase [Gemmatimonadetes bacterium]|nr:rane-associated phospholipid phosphatase [Gemmatimonadota bacterium]
MTSPDPNDSQHPSGSSERREVRRGHLVRFWDLIYAGLRKIGVHVSSFYVTVGVFLVAGAIIAIVATMGFAELAEHVLTGGTQAFDVAVLQWIHEHQTKLLTQIMTEVTYLGTGTVVLTIVGVTALFLWHTEHKHSARLLLAATAGNILLNGALKLVYHRARPTVFEWQTVAVSSSFPSGHAMSATVVYGTVAYLLMRLQKHVWAKALTLSGAIILILLICLTRLYLGVHYPSDVLGGIIVGLAWAAFCMATLEASLVIGRRRAPRDVEEVPAPKELQDTHAKEVAAV